MRIVERFRIDRELEAVEVVAELWDGAVHRLETLTPEPGFGFLTLVPVPEPEEPPSLLVVPVGALRGFTISPPDPEHPFGFSVVDAAS